MKKIEEDPYYISILHYIYKRGRGYPDELAYKMGTSRQAIDYRLRKLVEHQYLRKVRDERVYYIITDKGRRILESKNRSVKEGVDSAEIGSDLNGKTSSDLKLKIKSKLFLIPISLGLITLGQHIASGDIARGMFAMGIWLLISLVIYMKFR